MSFVLRQLMWVPLTPAYTPEITPRPMYLCASSKEDLTATLTSSMLSMRPFCIPWEVTIPVPKIFRSPSAPTLATIEQTLLLPMSTAV